MFGMGWRFTCYRVGGWVAQLCGDASFELERVTLRLYFGRRSGTHLRLVLLQCCLRADLARSRPVRYATIVCCQVMMTCSIESSTVVY